MPFSTPMMKQYMSIKRKNADALLFFRMGDFYEMFYDDARIAAKVLGITLTSRSKGEKAVPMAGIPYHAAGAYIPKLIKAGYKIAVCEQLKNGAEKNDSKAGTKEIVERDVVRVITPGTLTEDTMLDDKDNNYLLSLFLNDDKFGLSWVDISTGKFMVQDVNKSSLLDELTRINPSECIIPENIAFNEFDLSERISADFNAMVTRRSDWEFSRETAYQKLIDHFCTASLEGFGCEDIGPSLSAAGALINYLNETQKTSLAHINKIEKYSSHNRLILDHSTQQSLELVRTARTHQKEGSLLSVIDRTKTPMGGRLIKSWLVSPLCVSGDINVRQDGVEELYNNKNLCREVRKFLGDVYDIERISAKINFGRANARDLISLKQSISLLPKLKSEVSVCNSSILKLCHETLDVLEEVRVLINTAIVPEPPQSVRDGGIILEGYDHDLDELRNISRNGKSWIAAFQSQETDRTGISSLKVGYNKVFGYYIEITNVHKDRIPETYIRKQTLKHAERYITPELKEYETKVLTADERAKDMEYEAFQRIREEVSAYTERMQKTADVIAHLDGLSTLANIAAENGYTRPEISDGLNLRIIDGRHPVLDKTLMAEKFVPNDIDINGTDKQIMVITGPNMAGKSTYIRQVALLVLMAQMGSFIPAKEAAIGVVDRIFTRVGAMDELARGQSTFMVEMNEAANILNNATKRSLIILDEVGRGTSTFDGVSIAWALTEYIYERLKARTLFATHYHELTELALLFPGIRNYNIAVREWEDEIIFLRKIVEGGADKSYGIHVARLAGMPGEVIQRAKVILANLEAETLDMDGKPKFASIKRERDNKPKQLTLFNPPQNLVIEEIRNIDTSKITPIEALNKLHKLKEKLEE
ncbi:MAG: DNA mismatch repair protein MutS [Planctomycetes bacterium RIFCSPHIGHO2_02_FULL_40_12]|nr:MAG: DNA mismatch repair protein MutS [Planctomycetes bacterium RIFCSPHIGHO2_02_FULL_40_12]OHC01688.1 MAG: DNA mismatch repair protein MutS [Planctomycetes bacterium RIFCSPLOWO2_12_FULL_40_19]